jgi:hypothetical protein
MKTDRNSETEPRNQADADRRQFLRSAIRVGGAAALLLTPASRKLLASSLTLSSEDVEAAQRARQIQGAALDSHALEAESRQPDGEISEGSCVFCGGCSYTCSGTCSGGCEGGCQGCSGCTGTCSGGCSGTCQWSCGSCAI